MRDSLTRAGFKVTDEATTPRLSLVLHEEVQVHIPDSIVFTTTLEVYQRVSLHRLNQDMTLPVATMVTVTRAPEDTAPSAAEQQTRQLIEMFSTLVARASLGRNRS